MIVIIIIGFFAVFFAWLKSIDKNNFGLIISFILIFIFLALRFDFGNDYLAYYEHFDSVKDSYWSDVDLLYGENLIAGQMEFGYVLLVKFISLFSIFFFFIVIHSFLMCSVYYFLIKKYIDIKFAWLGVLIFVFLPDILSVELSAIRQALAIFCFMFSVRYLIERILLNIFYVFY
jgi:hypothetical protein